MLAFFISVILLIFFMIICISSVEWSMGLCMEYWDDKQYRLWKLICGIIGCCFLIAILFVLLLSPDRFSDDMNRITIALVVSAIISMGLFLNIIHLIAWKNKQKILKDKIRKKIKDNLAGKDKAKLLTDCLYENKEYFTDKQIKRTFKKTYSEFIQIFNEV